MFIYVSVFPIAYVIKENKVIQKNYEDFKKWTGFFFNFIAVLAKSWWVVTLIYKKSIGYFHIICMFL